MRRVLLLLVGLAGAAGRGLFSWEELWQRQSYYEVLGVPESASGRDIKKAYRRMAVKMHPDKLEIRSEEEKVSAENNFVKLARAYEILSDDKVKRRRYDQLLKDGVVEYPENSNYNWDWVDQKIGLRRQYDHDEGAFWARQNSNSAYEEAKKFYEAEKKWSWETDTTLQDLYDNPMVIVLFVVAVASIYLPRGTIDRMLKFIKGNEKKKRMENINKTKGAGMQNVGLSKPQNRKGLIDKQKREREVAEKEEVADELERLDIARSDLTVLLQAHICDIILVCSSEPSQSDPIDWLSVGESDISDSDIHYVCGQINETKIFDDYADNIVNCFPGIDSGEADHDVTTQCSEHDRLDRISLLRPVLDTMIRILDERRKLQLKMVQAHEKKKLKSTGIKVNSSREWNSAMISCLAKGVNKYQSHRKRWDLVTDYMNHILTPQEPFTKAECIQQAQNIQSIKKGNEQKSKADERTPISTRKIVAESDVKSNDIVTALSETDLSNDASKAWSSDQQKELERGLQMCSNLQGGAKWKAICEGVKGKTAAECIERYKFLRNQLKKKKELEPMSNVNK